MGEIIKALAPVAPILVGAWLAWAVRRAERLKDAWADFTAALLRLADFRDGPTYGKYATNYDGGFELDPLWLEWRKTQSDLRTNLQVTRTVLLIREPHQKLRFWIRRVDALTSDQARRFVAEILNRLATTDKIVLRFRDLKFSLPDELNTTLGKYTGPDEEL